jgi:hypothetical protein
MRRLLPGAAELQVAARITFPDHILYKDSDLDRIEKAARLSIEIEDEEVEVGRPAHRLMNLPAPPLERQ